MCGRCIHSLRVCTEELLQVVRAKTGASSSLPDDVKLHQKLGLSPNLIKIVNQEANSSRQNFAARLVKVVHFKKEREM